MNKTRLILLSFFTVLSQNVFEVQPNQINQAPVVQAYLQGELIYQ